ncbi:MAG TPA: hypothetical protein VGP13_03980 [Candidatus Paceibacterota bacterium]|jgi:hypothetical protein|nr:hypothetical protein [Candidatus Paceibacterota bacterium]
MISGNWSSQAMPKVLTNKDGVSILPTAMLRMSAEEIFSLVGELPKDEIVNAAVENMRYLSPDVSVREAGATFVPDESTKAGLEFVFEMTEDEFCWPALA